MSSSSTPVPRGFTPGFGIAALQAAGSGITPLPALSSVNLFQDETVEKLAEILPGDLTGFQFYDSGTTAVEAGQRILRAASGKHEMISCFNDYHGKTYGGVSLGHIRSTVYGPTRAPRLPYGAATGYLPSPVDESRRHD